MPLRLNKFLWALWGAIIFALLLKRELDPYLVIALVLIPMLVFLIELHDEIQQLKEENKHQRKFVIDRCTLFQDQLKDLSSQVEKRLVADFAELARSSPNETYSYPADRKPSKKKKKKKSPPLPETTIDLNIETSKKKG